MFDNFCQAPELEVNPKKYNFFFFNTPRVTGRNIKRILGFGGYLTIKISRSSYDGVDDQESVVAIPPRSYDEEVSRVGL